MKAYTYNDRLVGVGNDQILGTDQGGGSKEYYAGQYISIDENDVISVTGLAPVSAVSGLEVEIETVSGKLPTTELGKFTIQSNVSGGPIEVLIPTDDAPVSAFYELNAQYDDALSNRTGPSTYYYVFKSPGYDNDTWSANPGDVIQVKVKETIQGLGAIIGFYASNSSPASSNAPTINYPSSTPLVAGTGATYVVEPGVYITGFGANPASSSYGKYITLMINAGGSGIYVDDILNKIEFTIGRPNAALGTKVNLDRYYLGNTSTITDTSGYTQAAIYADSTTKKQSVYLPYSMPSNWREDIVQAFEYGSNYNSPSTINFNYKYKQYRAYKYTSSPRRYQFAYCTDWDYANKLMTFVAYDNSGNAIEKWTLDYTTYSSNVWTTTPISSDTSDYIPYSASGVYLPNSKFEIDTEGQAYKVITAGSESNYNRFDDGGIIFYVSYAQLGTYEAVLPSNVTQISIQTNNPGNDVTGTYDIATHTATINVNALIEGYAVYVYAYDSSNPVILNSSNTTVKYIVPAVTEEYVLESELQTVSASIPTLPEEISLIAGANVQVEVTGASAIISSQGGGTTYSAGQYVSIDENDVISVTGVQAAGSYATETYVQNYSVPVKVVASSAAATGTNILYVVTGS